MSGYDIYQQIFAVSMKVCGAAGQVGTPQSLAQAAATKLNTLFDALDDGWSIVWGPAVWQSFGSQVADQTLVVCYNQSQNLYQVAIAATNPKSKFDIYIEDLAVEPVLMRGLPADPKLKISDGNYIALHALTTMVPPVGQAGEGQTLVQCLQGITDPGGAKLVVSGHSLGGGLTPLLAYTLYADKVLGAGWGPIATYPTAAPTVGDQAFATAFASAFPAVNEGTANWSLWNKVLYNGRDIVPHAWSTTATPQLNDITAGSSGQMFNTSGAIAVLVEGLRLKALSMVDYDSPYITVPNDALFVGAQQTVPIDSLSSLESELLYQHIAAYIDQFQVQALMTPAEMDALIAVPLMTLLPAVGVSAEAAQTVRAPEAAPVA